MVASMEALAQAVRERAEGLGFDLVGFAPAAPFERERELILEDLARGHLTGMSWITADRVRLSCDPEALLPGVRTIVALGTAYASPEPQVENAGLRGRVARYAWSRDYHDVVPPKLRTLAAEIVGLAGKETRCRTFVDTGPLVDRAAAERAGVGFVGKNTCVLTGRFGSYVLLSAILTTAEISTEHVAQRDCGSCQLCLDACPTDAFVGPRQLDATRCISYLTIEHRGPIPIPLRSQIGSWVFGCDVCQEVCPWNRARPFAAHEELAPETGVGANLDLVELFDLDDAAFRQRFRGTPLTRAKRSGLLRNAAVVLGNLGDPVAIPSLAHALDDVDPLVRRHAAWALGQLGEKSSEAPSALRAKLAAETDPDVMEELLAALQ